MRMRHVSVLGAMLLGLSLCFAARADVLDQVPSDALVVLKVKNLDDASRKIAKWAKDLGLDQQEPGWADPLGALADKTHLGKGVNRGGDLAVAMLDPQKFGGDSDKAIIALVPVANYQQFLSNFKKTADAGDGITKATPQEGTDDAYVANWGQYAAISPEKATLAKKPDGIKLTGFAAKENDAKDAIVYVNIAAVRALVLPEMKKGREWLLDQAKQALEGQQNGKKYIPLLNAAINQLVNIGEGFFNEARSATAGLAVTENGITLTFGADFEPTSYAGKLALESKGTTSSLLNGLPGGAGRKYFLFGGFQSDPKTTQRVISDLLDPIIKELDAVEDTKKFAATLNTARKAYGSLSGSTIGMVAPTGQLGQESVIQEVSVIRGDAKVLQESQRQILASMNDLTSILPQQPGMKTSFELKPGAKTVSGVTLDSYETKIQLSQDDPNQAQLDQLLKFIYGPNGLTGVMGAVNDKTLIAVQGGSDQLIADMIAAAKTDADALGADPAVRAVANELPKEKLMVLYVDIGTIVNTTVRYAKSFGAPVNVKIPADLPPIGISASAEGTAFRADVHIPNRLVQGLVSAYMEAQRQMRNPNGGL
jgi:hypothetical protein